MNHLIFLLLFFLSISCYVEAQSSPSYGYLVAGSAANNAQPSMEVVIGILAVMVSLILVFLLYSKFRQRAVSVRNNAQQNPDGFITPSSRFSGIDKTVVESLPFFRFSALKGSREGLECAVCLSQFQDIEILRLLPKCKHAFHITCIDQWLENHSSCPLCRHKISTDDLASSSYTNSMRFMSSLAEVAEDANMELFVEREESCRESSRFSVANSFRKLDNKGVIKEEKIPIRDKFDGVDENDKFLHKFNHKIIVSGIVLKRRWSNLSPSDLVSLNSQMLGDASSNRFSSFDSNTRQNSATRAIEDDRIRNVAEEMERNSSRVLNRNDSRSMSDITLGSRFKESNNVRESAYPEDTTKEERLKRLWLPIAQRTVQWYANRETDSQESSNPRQSLNV